LPPWNISEPAREHEEHPYNPTPDNPFKKIPLRVTFDVVVLAAEPTGFVAVWIVHNSKDWRNALAGSMSDLVVGIRLALCVLSKPDANTGTRSGEKIVGGGGDKFIIIEYSRRLNIQMTRIWAKSNVKTKQSGKDFGAASAGWRISRTRAARLTMRFARIAAVR
jgi:hypothetical protein